MQLGQIKPERSFPDLRLSFVRYDPDVVMDTHAHDEAGVSVVLGGSISETVGHSEEFGNVGDVVIKPAGILHRNRVAPAGAILFAIKGEQVKMTLSGGWRWTRVNRANAIGLKAASLALSGQHDDARAAAYGLLTLLAGLDESVFAHDLHGSLPLIRARIEDGVEPLSVAFLAAIAQVHPVSLTRAFRRNYGCSVSEYIRRSRVRRAAALLLRGEENVGDIAAAVGCYDQSHLCREFKRELGTSPSAYRGLVKQFQRSIG